VAQAADARQPVTKDEFKPQFQVNIKINILSFPSSPTTTTEAS